MVELKVALKDGYIEGAADVTGCEDKGLDVKGTS